MPIFEPRPVRLSELPARLAELSEAPSRFYLTGAMPREPLLAIVGTRHPSAEGQAFTEHLARDLTLAGVSVISGGAEGIDAAAHRGVLAASGATLVVAPGGWQRPFPATNRELFERIVKAGGGYLSLCRPEQSATRGVFFRRNGCLVALSHAVVLVEAPFRSGARNAAKHARRLGRPLLVVPSSPWNRAGTGCNLELCAGARLVQSAKDVLRVLARFAVHPVAPLAVKGQTSLFQQPETNDQRVLAALAGGARQADQIGHQTGLSAAEVQGSILALRLAGRVSMDATGQLQLTSA